MDGGMAAVIGLTLAKIQQLLNDNQLKDIAIANHNSYQQIVISGSKSDMKRTKILSKIKSVLFIPLKVMAHFIHHLCYLRETILGFSTQTFIRNTNDARSRESECDTLSPCCNFA